MLASASILLLVTCVYPQCKISQPTTKATGTQGLTPSVAMEYLDWLALNKC